VDRFVFGEGADGEKLQAEAEDEEVLVALLPALAHAGSGKERLQVQTGPTLALALRPTLPQHSPEVVAGGEGRPSCHLLPVTH
jgi:hypothetical protein